MVLNVFEQRKRFHFKTDDLFTQDARTKTKPTATFTSTFAIPASVGNT